MNIAICDKSAVFLSRFIAEVQAYDPLIDVHTYTGYKQLTGSSDLLCYDCFFVSTEINSQSGVEVALEIKRQRPDAEIIFVTENCAEYCQRIFDYADEFRPYAMIKKPVSRMFMRHILDMLKRTIEQHSSRNIIIRLTDKEYISLSVSDILYVQHNNRISYIHTSDGECFESRYSISWFEENLPENFLHCSKSCIVNVTKIKAVSDMEIQLIDCETVWCSRQYKKDFLDKFSNMRKDPKDTGYMNF